MFTSHNAIYQSLNVSQLYGIIVILYIYRSVPGKRPLPGKRPCTSFQGVYVSAFIQTYGSYIPSKRPCGPKSRVMFNHIYRRLPGTLLYYNFIQGEGLTDRWLFLGMFLLCLPVICALIVRFSISLRLEIQQPLNEVLLNIYKLYCYSMLTMFIIRGR